jgi:hypothetical protein
MKTSLLVLTTRLHISSLFLSFVSLCQILFSETTTHASPISILFVSLSSQHLLESVCLPHRVTKYCMCDLLGSGWPRRTSSSCIWPIHALLSDAMHRLYMGLPYTTYTGCLIAAFPTLTWCHLSSPSLCGNVVKCRERWGSSGSLAARVSRASWT